MFPPNNPDGIQRIFDAKRKKDLVAICKAETIHANDFANLVLVADLGLLKPYLHRRFTRIITPDHLHPTEEEHLAVQSSGVGQLQGPALKWAVKVRQVFLDRRVLVGHMFRTRDWRYWYFFYFDQRDMDRKRNHWRRGPHIHLITDLWPSVDPRDLVENFNTGNPNLKGSLYVRYEDSRWVA